MLAMFIAGSPGNSSGSPSTGMATLPQSPRRGTALALRWCGFPSVLFNPPMLYRRLASREDRFSMTTYREDHMPSLYDVTFELARDDDADDDMVPTDPAGTYEYVSPDCGDAYIRCSGQCRTCTL